jgi:hypothetical protein
VSVIHRVMAATGVSFLVCFIGGPILQNGVVAGIGFLGVCVSLFVGLWWAAS